MSSIFSYRSCFALSFINGMKTEIGKHLARLLCRAFKEHLKKGHGIRPWIRMIALVLLPFRTNGVCLAFPPVWVASMRWYRNIIDFCCVVDGRDVSPGNVLESEGRGILIDFHAAVRGSGSESGRIVITGTTNYLALGLHVDIYPGTMGHCLSFDLESLMYTVYYIALPGKLPWSHCLKEADLVAVKSMTMKSQGLWAKQLGFCAEHLRPLVGALHDVFFVPTPGDEVADFRYTPGKVTLDQFLAACTPFAMAV